MEIKTFRNGYLEFSTVINPNDTGLMRYSSAHSNPKSSLGITHSDSIAIQFDETKLYVFPNPPNKEYTVDFDIQSPDNYEVQDCEKRKRYCTRVFLHHRRTLFTS